MTGPRLRLLWITPPEADLTRVRQILQGLRGDTTANSVALLLRRKGQAAETKALLAEGQELRRLTRDCGVRLLISRRIDVALALGADGVHVPENGVPVKEARRLLPWVSASRHDKEGLLKAESDGAQLCTLSPLFETPGKGEPLGEQRFRAAATALSAMQLAALGGVVTAADAQRAKNLGATAVATIRGVRNVQTIRSFLSVWSS